MKWADDKDTDHCQLCKQAFSISRRKVSEERRNRWNICSVSLRNSLFICFLTIYTSRIWLTQLLEIKAGMKAMKNN